eukprot:superscaffoldBa00000362_g4122
MAHLAHDLPQGLFEVIRNAVSTFLLIVIFYLLQYIFDMHFECSCKPDEGIHVNGVLYLAVPPFILTWIVNVIELFPKRKIFPNCRYRVCGFILQLIIKYLCLSAIWGATVLFDGDWYFCLMTNHNISQTGIPCKEKLTHEENLIKIQYKTKSLPPAEAASVLEDENMKGESNREEDSDVVSTPPTPLTLPAEAASVLEGLFCLEIYSNKLIMEFIEGNYRPIRLCESFLGLFIKTCDLLYVIRISLVDELWRLQQRKQLPSAVTAEDMSDLLVEESKSTVRVKLWEFELEDFDADVESFLTLECFFTIIQDETAAPRPEPDSASASSPPPPLTPPHEGPIITAEQGERTISHEAKMKKGGVRCFFNWVRKTFCCFLPEDTD